MMTGLMEPSGYVVAYDLPSENRLDYSDKGVRDRARAIRVRATMKLHRLGVNATESVVLVPQSKGELIGKTVKEVYELYRELDKWLKDKGLWGVEEPLIRVIEITPEQKEDFKALAERKLKERLDRAIERIAKLLNEIDVIVEEAKRKRLIYNLNKQQRELSRVEAIAKELSIETNNKFELLIELYNQAIDVLRSEL